MVRSRYLFASYLLALTMHWEASAQQVTLLHDSIEHQLQLADTDTKRIRLHDQLGMLYVDMTENDVAVQHISAGVELARAMNDPEGLAYAPLIQGLQDLDARRYDQALAAFHRTIDLLDGLNVKQGLLSPLCLVRQLYNETGQQKERLAFYTRKLDQYREHGPRENMGACYHGIAGYYFSGGQPDKSIENYLRAREIWSGFDPVGYANEAWPISSMYLSWGNMEKAEEYLRLSVEENRHVGLLTNLFSAYGGMAELNRVKGDTAAALSALNLSRPYWDRCPPLVLAPHLLALVDIHLARGDLDSAGRYISMVDSLDRRKRLYLYSAKGEIELDYYRSLYLRTKGDISGADASLKRALEVATEQHSVRYVQKYRKLLAARYQALGKTQEALRLLMDYTHMNDSLTQQADQGRIAGYELDMKEREGREQRQRQEAQMKQQRIVMIASIGFAILLLIMVVLAIRNIRLKQRANQALDIARQRAEASEKFKQQFLANMSHEIRTPMNAIMGMTGILKRNEQLPEQKKYLDAIAQSSENLLVILNDILDLSKLEAGKIEMEKVVFDPRQVIGNVRDILRFKAEEKGIALELDIAADVPQALIGDPTRLNQIVLNLAGNAIKFTESGSVTIRTAWTSRGELAVDVIDTGIGIPEDRLDKIFEEFTQAYSDTTRRYGGTGLGLTISKRLAEKQGGSLMVKSEQGKGSTFTVRIPYAIASSIVEAPGQALSDNAVGALRDLRILLAEDNEFNVMVAQDELADAIPGSTIDVAANGAIAVKMIQDKDYDLVLMDVQMPEMNGYDATRAIRALPGRKSRTPIVAMTANVMKDEIERCMEAGMDGYIPKPFKREELMSALMATR